MTTAPHSQANAEKKTKAPGLTRNSSSSWQGEEKQLFLKIGRGNLTTECIRQPHDIIDVFYLGHQGIYRKAAPLYEAGWLLREIAKRIGVSAHRVRRSLKRFGVVLRPSNRKLRKDLPPSERPHLGVAPFGFVCLHGKLVEDPREQEVVRLIVELRQGGKNLSAIASYLNEHKVKPRIAKKWDHSTIRSILQHFKHSES